MNSKRVTDSEQERGRGPAELARHLRKQSEQGHAEQHAGAEGHDDAGTVAGAAQPEPEAGGADRDARRRERRDGSRFR